jgi:hypothetical protein
MGRPPEPRSRSAAARVTGIHESTLRALERSGDLPPAPQWSAADLVWARVLTAPGVDRATLPRRPDGFLSGSYLVVAADPVMQTAPSLIAVVAAVEQLGSQPAVTLPVGRWREEIEPLWP